VKAQVPVIFNSKIWMSIFFLMILMIIMVIKTIYTLLGRFFRTVTYLHVQDKFGDLEHSFLFFPLSIKDK